MKTISLYVDEEKYRELQALAKENDRPVAELIREAMADYVERKRRPQKSIFDIKPHHSGPLLKEWTRSELLDEMLERD